ncbi:CaM_binding domain-containing protein, partial [Cephalotus follicularis]
YSTGKIDAPNSSVKILSRYLRASTGSCHDYCKYGRRHDVETKPWSPMLKKTTISSETLGQEMIQETATSSRTKRLAMGLKPSTDSVVIKRELPSVTNKVTVSSMQASSPSKKIHVFLKRVGDSKLKSVQLKPRSRPTLGYIEATKNSEIIKNKELGALPMNSVRDSYSRIKSEIIEAKAVRVLVPPSVVSTPKRSAKRVRITNAKNSEKLTKISDSRNQSNVRKIKPEQSSIEDVPEKTLYMVECTTENESVTPVQDFDHSRDLSPSSSSSEGKQLKHTQTGPSTGRSPPSVEKENLRHTQNQHSRYGTNIARLSSSSKSSHIKASSEHGERETKNQMMNLKVENKSRAGKGGIISPKDKDSIAQKLKFRRGKVVELRSEVFLPRRLKFRPRVLVDSTNGKVEVARRNIGKKEGDFGKVNTNRIQSILSKKVVLRHQNVEGKKEVRSLFNNVIEETASKLVETRKSKVKALVGAFETVISLQGSKPKANGNA